MRECGGPDDSTSEIILYKLETVYLGLEKIKLERVAVIMILNWTMEVAIVLAVIRSR